MCRPGGFSYEFVDSYKQSPLIYPHYLCNNQRRIDWTFRAEYGMMEPINRKGNSHDKIRN